MTYALAWKTKDEVFLAADTAITTSSSSEQLTLDLMTSSFGQEHVLDDDGHRKVEERVVKLFLKHKIGVTFAGNYPLALNLITSFYKKIEAGESVEESLKWAAFENPIPKEKDLKVVVGYYENGPKLLCYNIDNDLKIKSDRDIVQIGNPSNLHRQMSETWIGKVNVETPGKPELNLSSLLGVFQSYNLFTPQISSGVGGAFCGLYITKDVARWQNDILFIEYRSQQEKVVGTCFRHDCLVINSPTIGQSRCLISHTQGQTAEFIYSQALKATEKGRKLHRKSEYEYVVIISAERMNITVIEMKRNTRHALIWLDSAKSGDVRSRSITFFPDLRKILTRDDPRLLTISYMAPVVKKLDRDNVATRRIN